MPAKLRVGLTGGIASGKSTVARLFAALGASIIDADVVAREVVAPGTELLGRVAARFGPQILAPDGSLERRALRAIVFADPAARAALEGLTHPAIRAAMEAQAARASGAYLVLVIPLLIEQGRAAMPVDRILVVDCEVATQLARLQARDGATLAQARAMLAAQTSREARLAAADDVIVNEGDLRMLTAQVERLHARYLQGRASARP